VARGLEKPTVAKVVEGGRSQCGTGPMDLSQQRQIAATAAASVGPILFRPASRANETLWFGARIEHHCEYASRS
jgi:hypothetical protein